jgi:hypothetical protein
MKIKPWNIKKRCSNCGSKLIIEHYEIKPIGKPTRIFNVVCKTIIGHNTFCNTSIVIREKEIPPAILQKIKERTRAWKK